VILLSWHYIQKMCKYPYMLFLDKPCVDQVYGLRKAEAICSLGAFLNRSRRLVIFYGVATRKHLDRSRKRLQFQPTSQAVMFCSFIFINPTYLAVRAVFWILFSEHSAVLTLVLPPVAAIAGAWWALNQIRSFRCLAPQIRSFSFT